MAHTCAHPVELLAVAAVAIGRALRPLLVAVLAVLLLLAGYQPGPAVAAPAAAVEAPAAPIARDWAGRPLEALTVKELRVLARTAGHRSLARSGRRADLLAVLS